MAYEIWVESSAWGWLCQKMIWVAILTKSGATGYWIGSLPIHSLSPPTIPLSLLCHCYFILNVGFVTWNLLRNPSFALTFLNFELGLFLSMWFWIEFSQKGSLCCFVFFCVCVCVFFGGVGWWRFSKKDIHYSTEECLMFSSASPCEHRSRLAWFFWCNWRWVS